MTTNTEMWPARDAYNLTIYATAGLRSYVGDGQERYWIDSSSLNEEVELSSGSGEADADAYAAWCVAGHASQDGERLGADEIRRIARDLDSLLDLIQSGAVSDESLTNLPAYGGEEPANTNGIWSWDATRLLVSSASGDLRIVEREAD